MLDSAEVETGTSPAMPRRRFVRITLGFSVLTTIGMIVAPIVGFLMPSRRPQAAGGGRVLAGTTADLAVGKSTVVAVRSKPVIVLNAETSGVKAFSAVCTHLGCIVGYDGARSPDIVSPCHDGHFSVVDGRVISGPPPLPLAEYEVAIDGDEIYVLG